MQCSPLGTNSPNTSPVYVAFEIERTTQNDLCKHSQLFTIVDAYYYNVVSNITHYQEDEHIWTTIFSNSELWRLIFYHGVITVFQGELYFSAQFAGGSYTACNGTISSSVGMCDTRFNIPLLPDVFLIP